jgi:hypothetical protein
MPFLLLRTASVLATGFLLAGPSAPPAASAGSAISGLPAATAAPCPTHWAANQFSVPSGLSPAGFDSQIMSIATLSPSDVWMLIKGTDKHGNNISAVYHRTGSVWRESANLAGNDGAFGAEWIVARSDTDVWVVGSSHWIPKAWNYDGSSWTDHPPTRYSHATINAAALGSDGTLYLGGSNRNTHKGIILGYDGSRWTNLSPVNPPRQYKALTVGADGTLIAAGGGQNDGTLQERSGTAWTTISLSAPVNSITKVSVGPDGTVYGVGSVAGEPLLIKQPRGSRSASVLNPSAMGTTSTFTNEAGVVALGLDVWLLGEGEPHSGWHHPWFTYDGGFGGRGRRWSHAAIGSSSGDPRSDRPCWSTGSQSLPGSSLCGRHGSRYHHHHHHHGGGRRSGCRCPDPSQLQKGSGTVW